MHIDGKFNSFGDASLSMFLNKSLEIFLGKYGQALICPEVIKTNPYEKTADVRLESIKDEDFYEFWAAINFCPKSEYKITLLSY